MLTCTPIECLGEFCQCGDIVLTALSPITGVLLMRGEFNGAVIEKEVNAYAGQPIVVPNVFNETYTHVIGFYNGTELVNETRYAVKIVYCIDLDYVPIPDFDMANSIIFSTMAGSDEATDNRINGRVVTGLMIDDLSKNTGYFVANSTITLTDGSTFGNVLTVIFE